MKSLIMGLLASKLFKTPVISRLEVHHYVTKYVPVTHTTTLLVGITATPVVHHPSPAIATPTGAARPPLDPYAYANAPTNHGFRVFDPASALSSFGQWLAQPVNLTPLDIIQYVILLSMLASLLTFLNASSKRYRHYAQLVSKQVLTAYAVGCIVPWMFLFFLLHYLGYGNHLDDPLESLSVVLRGLYDDYPSCMLVVLFQRIPRWWRKHRAAHRGTFQAIWTEVKLVLSGIGRRIFQTLLGFAQWLLQWLPHYAAKAWARLRDCCIWLWTQLSAESQRMWTNTDLLRQRLRPSEICFRLEVWWIGDRPKYVLRRHLANMTLEQRLKLHDEVVQTRKNLHDFNHNAVVDLAKRTQDYKHTIHALIKECNYLRHCMDLYSSYVTNLREGRQRLDLSQRRYFSAHLHFCPHKTEQGFHYDTAEGRASWNKDLAYKANPAPAMTRLSLSRPVIRTALFQRYAWGLEAKMHGVTIPPYEKEIDAYTARNQTKGPSEPQVEDQAAQGKLLEMAGIKCG